MLLYTLAQFRQRKSRIAALTLGILVAAISFVLLTASVSAGRLQVKGTIANNFRSAYDILVRPKNSFSQLEKSRGLVSDNYLSGIFGGITMKQYRVIKTLPGIDVAAPIANIGYILPFQFQPIYITKFLTKAPVQLYRLEYSWNANGTTGYPDAPGFVYYTRTQRFTHDPRVHGLPHLANPPICSHFGSSIPSGSGPFGFRGRGLPPGNPFMTCFSQKTPNLFSSDEFTRYSKRRIGIEVGVYFPILISAIDPSEENRLLGLKGAMVSGSYLRSDQGVGRDHRQRPFVHVLASTRTFLGDDLNVTIERLKTPPSPQLTRRLGDIHSGFSYALHLRGHVVAHRQIPPEPVYRRFLDQSSKFPGKVRYPTSYTGYYTTSGVKYSEVPSGQLKAGVGAGAKLTP